MAFFLGHAEEMALRSQRQPRSLSTLLSELFFKYTRIHPRIRVRENEGGRKRRAWRVDNVEERVPNPTSHRHTSLKPMPCPLAAKL